MSVINQMLNGLEQRGVDIAADQVRPVHEVSESSWLKWALPVLAGLMIFAWFMRPVAPVAVVIAAIPAASAVPAVSGVMAASAVASEVIAASAVMAASEVIAIPELIAVSEVIAMPEVVHAAPALSGKADRTVPVVRERAPVLHEKTKAPNVASLPDSQPIKQVSATQQADAEFRKASLLAQQGKSTEAQSGFESALRLDPGHEAARRSLVALLLEGKRAAEAEQTLQEGLTVKPAHSGFAMLLARLQVERGALDQAIATLETTLPHAVQQADYQAFYAALLQRKGRHQDAVDHYQLALKIVPDSGVWLMGYGISLQALSRPAEAKLAFQQSLDSKSLSVQLQAFVQQKIKGL